MLFPCTVNISNVKLTTKISYRVNIIASDGLVTFGAWLSAASLQPMLEITSTVLWLWCHHLYMERRTKTTRTCDDVSDSISCTNVFAKKLGPCCWHAAPLTCLVFTDFDDWNQGIMFLSGYISVVVCLGIVSSYSVSLFKVIIVQICSQALHTYGKIPRGVSKCLLEIFCQECVSDEVYLSSSLDCTR